MTEQEKNDIISSTLREVLSAFIMGQSAVVDVDGYFVEYKLKCDVFIDQLEQKIKSLTPPENT